jgi:pyruvate dehydrogenase E1 component
MISPWVPSRYVALGTDGFGRSESRQALRRYFEVDAESIVVATLTALAVEGKVQRSAIAAAIKMLDIDPEKINPASI